LFRQGVVSALQGEPDFQVVGETDSGEQALQMARTLMPR
jgi:two-component system nitrate/nitrite response regulator NarL